MHPMFSRIFGEQDSGASSAVAGICYNCQHDRVSFALTVVELLECPFTRNHRAIFLSFLFLSDLEVEQRVTVWRSSKLDILSVAIALIDAINKNIHGDAWCNKVPG